MPPIEVELPDGAIAEFPEGTPPEAIKRALSKYKAPIIQPGEGFMVGAGRNVDRVVEGVKGLYAKATGDAAGEAQIDAQTAEKRQIDQTGGLNDAPGSTLGGATADIAMTAQPGSAAVKGFQALAKAPGFLKMALGLGGAAGTNAAFEGVKAPDPGDTRTDNATTGALWGAGGQAAGNVLSRTISGLVKKSAAASKLPQHVQDASTTGQLADRKTFSGRLASGTEEKLRSVPLTGDIVSNARQRGTDAWRADVIDRVTPPGGTTPKGETMREVMDDLQGQFGDQYKAALAGNRISPSAPFESRVLKNTTDPMAGLTPAQQEEVRAMVMNYYQGMFHAGPMNAATGARGLSAGGTPGRPISITPEQAKQFESFLSSQARQHKMANQPQSQNMANIYEKIEDAWTGAYRSQLPVATRQKLKPLDAKYAPFKTAERGSTYVGNEQGDFTPSQLLTAVKSRTNKSEFARGGGLLQEEADLGKSVYQDRIPNSGTADRAMNLGAVSALALDPTGTAATLLGSTGAMSGMLATKSGKNFMLGETRVQELLKRLRADKALANAGVPIGQAVDDLLTE